MEYASIKAVPDLHADLRVAAKAGILVPFIGAGVSKLAGCPGWDDLATRALENLAVRGTITYAHLEQMRFLNPRVKLSLAKAIARKQGNPIDFRELLQAPGWNQNDKGIRAYTALGAMAHSFVTTNYDEWLDEVIQSSANLASDEEPSATTPAIARQVFHRGQDLTLSNLSKPGAVMHVHGSLRDQGNMVLTTGDYLNFYGAPISGRERRSPALDFLEELFRLRTVLFVGYGMSDLEILEYIVMKSGQGERQNTTRHFILWGFFSHEVAFVEGMRDYFREFNVELLPYLRDHRDYDQLIVVLEAFARELPASPLARSQSLIDMERLLNG